MKRCNKSIKKLQVTKTGVHPIQFQSQTRFKPSTNWTAMIIIIIIMGTSQVWPPQANCFYHTFSKKKDRPSMMAFANSMKTHWKASNGHSEGEKYIFSATVTSLLLLFLAFSLGRKRREVIQSVSSFDLHNRQTSNELPKRHYCQTWSHSANS